MSRLVVFDVDGTILDSFGVFGRAVLEYSREQGLPDPCLDTIKIGYGDPHLHDFKWGVSREEQVRHLFATYKLADKWSVSGEADKSPVLFSGTRDMLTQLKDEGYTLAIVTSKSEAPLRHMLEHFRLEKMFSAWRSSSDVAKRGEAEKPAPDQLLSVMRELKFAPEQTAMVGDTVMDVKMGLGARSHTVGVTWGVHPRSHLEEAGAHHIADTHVGDLPLIARRIFG